MSASPDRAAPLTRRPWDAFGLTLDYAGLTARPQQVRLAELIDAAATGRAPGRAVAQAGTGTGKSYVLLCKAVDYGRPGRPAMVATVTNHLGRQYVDKDAPVVAAATGARITRLIGRGHYLCASSIAARKEGIEQPVDLDDYPPEDRAAVVADIRADREAWLARESDPALWATGWEHSAERGHDQDWACPSDCGGSFFHGCGRVLAGARAAWQADVVITNFHMLAINELVPQAGVLPWVAMTLVDEAHAVPDTFASMLSVDLDPEFGRVGITTVPEVEPAGREAVDMAQRFRRAALRHYDWSAVPSRVDERKVLLPTSAADRLDELLDEVEAASPLPMVAGPGADVDIDALSLRAGLRALARSARDPDVITSVHRPPDDDVMPAADAAPDTVYLRRADVAEFADRVLGHRAVLVSATVPESLPPRCGCPATPVRDVGTPFDYRRQVARLWVSTRDGRKSPPGESPGARRLRFAARIAELDAFAADGATLVLCSSHADVDMLAREWGPRLRDRGVEVLRQPRGPVDDPELTTAAVVEAFRSAPDRGTAAVLLGTDTLATGLDVPGPALSRVAWWSLPLGSMLLVDRRRQQVFPGRGRSVVGRPAPCSYLDGLLRTKVVQGIGRLVRTVDDTGEILLCDARFWSHLDGATSVLDRHLRPIAREWWPRADERSTA